MDHTTRPIRAVMFSVIPMFVESFDALLKERGHKLVGIVTAPGPRSRRSEEYRQVMAFARPGLDVIVSNYPSRWADMIRPLKPDVILSVGFNWKIPDDVLQVPTLGAINGHDSCLPKFRGRNATGWALRTGEPGYGASVHRMTSEFDQGPVMAQRSIAIGDEEDGDDLMLRLKQAGDEVLAEAYDLLVEGFPGIPQDEREATYAGGEFEPEWREIDWDRPARDVFFQIRSWCGFRGVPRGAFGEVDGRRLLISKAKPVSDDVDSFPAPPGTVVGQDGAGMLVQCADRPLRLLQWEDAPDEARRPQVTEERIPG